MWREVCFNLWFQFCWPRCVNIIFCFFNFGLVSYIIWESVNYKTEICRSCDDFAATYLCLEREGGEGTSSSVISHLSLLQTPPPSCCCCCCCCCCDGACVFFLFTNSFEGGWRRVGGGGQAMGVLWCAPARVGAFARGTIHTASLLLYMHNSTSVFGGAGLFFQCLIAHSCWLADWPAGWYVISSRRRHGYLHPSPLPLRLWFENLRGGNDFPLYLFPSPMTFWVSKWQEFLFFIVLALVLQKMRTYLFNFNCFSAVIRQAIYYR